MGEDIFTVSEFSILETAKTLFWKHGIKRVSVEEICSEAGVSKMTFYRKFKNKNDLVYALFDQLSAEGLAEYEAIMSLSIDFPEKVKKLIVYKHESSENLSQEFMLDIYKSDDERIATLVSETSERSKKMLAKDFLKAQNEGWIRSDIKMESIFYMLALIQEKITDANYLAMHANTHDAIMELTNFFFYGIISNGKTKNG